MEELLDRLASSADRTAAATAEQLVRALMDLYGAGLARAVELLSGRSGSPLDALLDDEVTAGLLVLHDLHPDDVPARVRRALRAADAGEWEIDSLDAETGALTLRQKASDSASGGSGGGCGCGSSTTDGVRVRVRAALAGFAPEVTQVDLLAAEPARREPPLLQIGLRPGAAAPVEAR
ncbi:hypothetical protein I2501_12260 [Streptacidiphilus sp. NEAU-YB345]|uniref:NifU family protein n=1 Tax=Streptacidiphilus fuscans TaxID=2789292 RepID=A0A931B3T4_9ACTN|nr:hypothetical protein [Streptacidiphilus fuscans]